MEKLKIIDISDQLTQNSDDVLKTMLETYEYGDFFYALEIFAPSQQMWAEIINKYPFLIGKVPAEYVTDEMCQYVLKTHYFNNILRHIPKRYRRNESFLIECVRNSDKSVIEWIVRHCNKEVLGERFWREALKLSNAEVLQLAFREGIIEEYRLDLNGLLADNTDLLRGVPARLCTIELCSAVVKQNGLALRNVPRRMKTEELCQLAMAQNPCAIVYAPIEYWNESIFQAAVLIDCSICSKAPKEYLDHLHWEEMISNNWRILEYAPKCFYKIDLLLDMLNDSPIERSTKQTNDIIGVVDSDRDILCRIAKRIPYKLHDNLKLRSLERQLELRAFTKLYYDNTNNRYCVWEKLLFSRYDPERHYKNAIEDIEHKTITINGRTYSTTNCYEIIERSFDNIQDFLDYCELSLNECPIEIQLSASIKDESFYNRTIRKYRDIESFKIAQGDKLMHSASLHDEEANLAIIDRPLNNLRQHIFYIFYISDIHLVHKLVQRYPQAVSQYEIYMYIKEMVNSLCEKSEITNQDVLLIGGDISSDFEIAKMFYTALAEIFKGKIIAILGNHELWPFKSVNEAYEAYNAFFEQYSNIALLNGMIILPNSFAMYSQLRDYHFTIEDILQKSSDSLRKLTQKSPLIIIGGMGFSANNPTFNAEIGAIYHQALNKEKDYIETQRFNRFYNKCHESCKKDRIVVFTHMPMSDWSSDKAEPNWVYLNGHTHRNMYICNDTQTLYADNQIGYSCKSISLKSFPMRKECDIFRLYEDGVYYISRHQYLEFNRYNGIQMSFNRTEGQIVMLKTKGYYMFLYCLDSGEVFLLNGGTLNKLSHNIDYYYSRIPILANIISNAMHPFQEALVKLSDAICVIGGDGTIHGNIIDIDFFNHLILDPISGHVIPYFAINIKNRIIYPNIAALLEQQLPSLYNNYLILKSDNDSIEKREKLATLDSTSIHADLFNALVDSVFENQWFVSEYKLSRLVRSMQYSTDVNIIRIWNDALLSQKIGEVKEIEV